MDKVKGAKDCKVNKRLKLHKSTPQFYAGKNLWPPHFYLHQGVHLAFKPHEINITYSEALSGG